VYLTSKEQELQETDIEISLGIYYRIIHLIGYEINIFCVHHIRGEKLTYFERN